MRNKEIGKDTELAWSKVYVDTNKTLHPDPIIIPKDLKKDVKKYVSMIVPCAPGSEDTILLNAMYLKKKYKDPKRLGYFEEKILCFVDTTCFNIHALNRFYERFGPHKLEPKDMYQGVDRHWIYAAYRESEGFFAHYENDKAPSIMVPFKGGVLFGNNEISGAYNTYIWNLEKRKKRQGKKLKNVLIKEKQGMFRATDCEEESGVLDVLENDQPLCFFNARTYVNYEDLFLPQRRIYEKIKERRYKDAVELMMKNPKWIERRL